MAQPFASPFPIVGPQYCTNQEIVLVFLPLANGDLVVADVNGSIKFVAKELHRTFAPNRWIIYDIAGNPIVTVKPKVWTSHSRCEVFREDSKELQDPIFTAEKHSMVSLKTKLDVFLARSKAEKVPDFKVKGSFSKKSCTICAGDENPIIIAEMQKKNEQNVDNILLGKGNFMVTAYSNVDCAFIVALIVILEGLERKSRAIRTMAANTANSAINVATDMQS